MDCAAWFFADKFSYRRLHQNQALDSDCHLGCKILLIRREIFKIELNQCDHDIAAY